MHLRAVLTIAFACLATAVRPHAAADCKSTVSGDLRIHSLASKIFNNTRSIRVLLPPGYDAAENRSKRYPVLYMLDGQNLFDACLSDVSHAEWQVDETVYRLIREKAIPEMIVVGIDHAGVKRAYEFLPYRDSIESRHGGARGQALPGLSRDRSDAVRERPIPHADRPRQHGARRLVVRWRRDALRTDGATETFGYGLIESPSIWVGMGQLIRDTSPLVAFPRKVFMAFGSEEMSHGAAEKQVQGFFATVVANFKAAGYDDSSFRYVYEQGAKHTESAWAKRLPDALKFLFADWKPSPASPTVPAVI